MGGISQCTNLGAMYEDGKGVKQDFFKAVQLYEKACNNNESGGCFNLGARYANGEGVKQNSKKALELYGKACDLKEEIGCKNYAILKKQMGL